MYAVTLKLRVFARSVGRTIERLDFDTAVGIIPEVGVCLTGKTFLDEFRVEHLAYNTDTNRHEAEGTMMECPNEDEALRCAERLIKLGWKRSGN